MISVMNQLMSSTVSYLADVLILETDDSTKAGLVRSGKLQADPTVAEFNILIRQGNDTWRHERAPNDYFAINEVGPFGLRSVFWLRRFEIEMKFFFVGETDRDVAINSAHVILSRAEKAIYTVPIPPDDDDFGEHALQVAIKDTYLNEGGGPGTFIHRGVARIEFLTEKVL